MIDNQDVKESYQQNYTESNTQCILRIKCRNDTRNDETLGEIFKLNFHTKN